MARLMAKRKVVAIAVGLDVAVVRDKATDVISMDGQALYVACDDGSIFYRPFRQEGWQKLEPPVPGTDADK